MRDEVISTDAAGVPIALLMTYAVHSEKVIVDNLAEMMNESNQ